MCARQILCLDHSNLQERGNISNYTWLLEGIYFLSMVLEVNVLNGILCKRDVPTEISLGWNKVSRCHTKPTSATFFRCDNAFCQYM